MNKRKSIRVYLLLFFFLFVALLITNCENSPSSSNDDDQPVQTTIITGQVILENQDEHSNCAIFDSMMTLLTGTDSSGFYEINFNSYFPDSTVRIKLFYFLYDYKFDFAEIQLEDGFVVFDSLDVDELGNIKLIKLQQVLDVICTVSKDTAAIGDTVRFDVDFKNISNGDLELYLQVSSLAGSIIISKGPFLQGYGFGDGGDSMGDYYTYYIQPGYSYVGYHENSIPDGKIHPVDYTFIPMIPGDYVMYSVFLCNENINSDYRFYILTSWDSFHIGPIPNTNRPLKIKAAKIHITK